MGVPVSVGENGGWHNQRGGRSSRQAVRRRAVTMNNRASMLMMLATLGLAVAPIGHAEPVGDMDKVCRGPVPTKAIRRSSTMVPSPPLSTCRCGTELSWLWTISRQLSPASSPPKSFRCSGCTPLQSASPGRQLGGRNLSRQHLRAGQVWRHRRRDRRPAGT